MRKILYVFVAVAALGLAACGDDGGSNVPLDVAQEDAVTEDGTGPEFGCQTAADCVGKYGPGACQKVDCIANSCAIVADPGKNGQACELDDLCQENAQCSMGQCKGMPKECTDGNYCTDGQCNAQTGECEFVPNSKSCDDGNPCTDGDKCQEGTCQGGESICDCTADADCEKYDDGNPCNGVVTCQAGACDVDEATVVDCSNVAVGPCEEAFCDETDGICKLMDKTDGAACDAEDLCVENTACLDGACAGDAVNCDDNNKCTDDSCQPAQGCVFTPVDNGTACNDGSLCTDNDACVDGTCTGDAVPECDSCESDEECQPFEDGNLCNGTLKCLDGKCEVDEATIVLCELPQGACQEAKCMPASGKCQYQDALDGTACEDQNLCTESDYCSGGVCKGLPLDCDDVNACTQDSCDPDTGCVNAPVANNCGDGDPCTINDHCDGGVCTGDPNPECQCVTDVDCEAFEDDDFCNGLLVCENKKCVVDPDTVIDCAIPGLNSCMSSICEPETGLCVLAQIDDGSQCDDENACTDGDKCFDGICKGGPLFCDDGNICTDDKCDVNLGCIYNYNNADCDDGSDCTLNDYCAEGFCTGDPNPACQCQSNADCTQFEDGNPCNGTLVCVGFKCQVDPDTVVTCDKSNDGDCKVTYCNPETGSCVTADFEDGKPCNDESACTIVDACSGGECVGSLSPDCEDDNPCTDDSCDPQLGCIAVPNTVQCDDGDPCTGGDKCGLGVCQPGDQDLCGDTCVPDWTLSCGGVDAWGTDSSGATDEVDKYSCNDFDYMGPEYTYNFTAEFDALITVSLSAEEADTDILVLESSGEGCDPDLCRDWDYSKVTFEALAGQHFYFVVDGFSGGVLPDEGSYTIDVECQPLHELDCGDGLDDDDDGFTDCDDLEDCLGSEACPLPVCEAAWSLECGESDAWAVQNWGHTDLIDGYACNGFDYTGPEYTYVFVAPVSKSITVKLTEETSETDILVLSGGDGECLPDNCVEWGMSEVAFDAVAGETYFLVVDGWAGAGGAYTITVECPPDVEANCEDNLDNDQDGKVDCLDTDCEFTEACAESCTPWLFEDEIGCGFEENFFNYGWLSTDNADSYVCTQALEDGPEYTYNFTAEFDAQVTVTLTEETADTDILVVEASDGECLTVNCIAAGLDEVTFDAVEGSLYYLVVDGHNGAEGSYHIAVECNPNTEMDCTDEMDEDQDGLADCEDSDCFPGGDCESACEPDDLDYAGMTCGSSDSWYNDGAGSADNVDFYSCNPYDYPAPEYTYTLTVDQDETVTVALSNEEDDEGEPIELDILVLEDMGLGCNPASCITYGLNAVTFEAEAGAIYYVVIDGYNGATGGYDIDISCM